MLLSGELFGSRVWGLGFSGFSAYGLGFRFKVAGVKRGSGGFLKPRSHLKPIRKQQLKQKR